MAWKCSAFDNRYGSVPRVRASYSGTQARRYRDRPSPVQQRPHTVRNPPSSNFTRQPVNMPARPVSARPTQNVSADLRKMFVRQPAKGTKHFKFSFLSAGRREVPWNENEEETEDRADTEPPIQTDDRYLSAGMGYGTKHRSHFRYISQRGKAKLSRYVDQQHHFDLSRPDTFRQDYSRLNHPSQFTGPHRSYFTELSITH